MIFGNKNMVTNLLYVFDREEVCVYIFQSVCQMLSSWADCETFKDYNGLDRIIVAKKRG